MISTTERTDTLSLAALRAEFALRLAELYGTEVPAYTTLVDVYDRMVAEVDAQLASAPNGATRVEVARQVWRDTLPATERDLALQGLAFFTYRVGGAAPAGDSPTLRELIEAGVLVPEPIVYEDFLPRSAAGIFQSNLTDKGTRDDALTGTPYDIDTLAEAIGLPIADPTGRYQAQQDASLDAAARSLGLRAIITD